MIRKVLAAVVNRFGPAVRRWVGKQKDSVRLRFGSFLSSKRCGCGHCLVTLSPTTNDALQWLSLLPIVIIIIMDNSYKALVSVKLSAL